jgi:hypothetical protein
LVGEVAAEELDRGVTLTSGPQLVEGGEGFEGEVGEADLSVEAEGRLEFVGFEGAAGELVEAGAEGVQVGGREAQSSRHGVAARADQQVAAFPQGSGQIEPRNTTARAAEFRAVPAKDNGRAIELLEDTGGDNADDTDVPGHIAFDDDEVGLGVEPDAHGAKDLVGNGAFDFLPLAVMRVQILRERQRFGQVAGQEQAQGFFGRFEPARGVEAGRELEADFVGAERDRGLSDPFQSDQTWSLRRVEAFQTGRDQHPVFAGQRDDVGDRGEGDQIEQGAQIKLRGAGQGDCTAALEEGVGEFEGEAGGAKFCEEVT